jgi:pre-rRNA-processing protein TSR3
MIKNLEVLKKWFITTGYQNLAKKYLDKFKWGKIFIKLNRDLLDKYAVCKDSAEVVQVQRQHMTLLDEERNRNRGNF